MQERTGALSVFSITLLTLGLLILAAAPAEPAAPKGKHYALVMMLPDSGGGLEATPACLSFSADEMCSESNECGPWSFTIKEGHRNEWQGTLEFTSDGILVRVEARGITERKGPGSSIGGTFMITIEGQEFNAGFGGTSTTRAECLAFGTTDD